MNTQDYGIAFTIGQYGATSLALNTDKYNDDQEKLSEAAFPETFSEAREHLPAGVYDADISSAVHDGIMAAWVQIHHCCL